MSAERFVFEPVNVLRVFADFQVRYVLIGGLAAAAHGSPSITNDLDVCHDRDFNNLERLAGALTQINARLRGVTEDVPFLLDAKTLRTGDSFSFMTDFGDVDCLGTPAGTAGFDALLRNAVEKEIGGLRVLVASVEDLIRMKRAAGRPQDLKEVEILGAIRDMTSER